MHASLAGYVARHALLEVLGYEPLRDLDCYHALGTATIETNPHGTATKTFQAEPTRSGDQLTDADLGGDESADTASAAAMAFGCTPDSSHYDPVQLLAFWEWWLHTAIPEGWARAQATAGLGKVQRRDCRAIPPAAQGKLPHSWCDCRSPVPVDVTMVLLSVSISTTSIASSTYVVRSQHPGVSESGIGRLRIPATWRIVSSRAETTRNCSAAVSAHRSGGSYDIPFVRI